VGGIAPERLVFLDECGVLTTLTRLYGRSPRGQRATGYVPLGGKKRLSVLGALGTGGMMASLGLHGAVNAASFAAYLEEVLLPDLRRHKPDAVLIMDNLPVHKTARVRAVLDGSGFPYRYLPADSLDPRSASRPEPIEPGWAKLKSHLRRVAARTIDALHQALGPALDAITPQDAAGFFRHCGYKGLN
jgi:transposase